MERPRRRRKCAERRSQQQSRRQTWRLLRAVTAPRASLWVRWQLSRDGVDRVSSTMTCSARCSRHTTLESGEGARLLRTEREGVRVEPLESACRAAIQTIHWLLPYQRVATRRFDCSQSAPHGPSRSPIADPSPPPPRLSIRAARPCQPLRTSLSPRLHAPPRQTAFVWE